MGHIRTLIAKSSSPKSGQDCWAAQRERQSAKKVKQMEIKGKNAIVTGGERGACYDQREEHKESDDGRHSD